MVKASLHIHKVDAIRGREKFPVVDASHRSIPYFTSAELPGGRRASRVPAALLIR